MAGSVQSADLVIILLIPLMQVTFLDGLLKELLIFWPVPPWLKALSSNAAIPYCSFAGFLFQEELHPITLPQCFSIRVHLMELSTEKVSSITPCCKSTCRRLILSQSISLSIFPSLAAEAFTSPATNWAWNLLHTKHTKAVSPRHGPFHELCEKLWH